MIVYTFKFFFGNDLTSYIQNKEERSKDHFIIVEHRTKRERESIYIIRKILHIL